MPLYKVIFFILFFCLITHTNAQTFSSDYKDGQIYVKFRDDMQAEFPANLLDASSSLRIPDSLIQQFHILSAERAFPLIKSSALNRSYRIKFSTPSDVFLLLEAMKQLPGVAFTERVPEYYSLLTPNDPSFTVNTTTQWGLYKIKAEQAWNITTGNSSVIVAVVDDAVKVTHQDLAGNLWTNPNEIAGNGIDDDLNGYIDDINGWDAADLDADANPPGTATNSNFTHGTHCAGIVAAKTNNAIGVASIGFNVSYIPVKCKLSSTSGSSIQAAMEGVQYALNTPAKIISMSWGGTASSSVEQLLFDYAFNAGVTLIAAAGNNGNQIPFYPANYNNVLAIGNTASNDARSSSSNYGNWIDLMAPGTNIYNCLAGNNSSYGNQTGTSMACPMVAGTAALMLSANPGLSPAMIYACLKDSADNINAQNTGIIGLIGSGRLNAYRSVQCAVSGFKPIARFTENNNQVCTGVPVQFTDQSFGSPLSWAWSFQGGSPATSSQQNPIVSWSTPGTYTVELIVTNAKGADTLTKIAHITINGGGRTLPFSEDFESNDFNTQGWFIDNPDNNFTWTIATTAGNPLGGTKSAQVQLYDYPFVGRRDGLVTPAIDLSIYSSAKMGFSRAFRQVPNINDSLLVKISTDCGVTWPVTALARGGNTLGTASALNAVFNPTLASHWCGNSVNCDTVLLNSYLTSSNVRIRFESVNRYGNNLFLDNIEITGVPKSDFTASQTVICIGQSVTFQETSTGGAINYAWSFTGGNITSSTLPNPVVTYNTPGTYQVRLTVSNAYGSHTQNRAGYIVVSGGIPVTVSAPGGLYCSSSSPVTLNTSPAGGTLSGTGITNGLFSPVIAGVGTHRVYYTYVDLWGCGGLDSTDIPVAASTPGVISGLAPSVCISAAPLTLSGTPAGGTFNGTGISGNIFNPALANQGSHQINYVYTDISGCTGQVSQLIQVNIAGTATTNIPSSVCINDLPYTLAGNPAGGNFSGSGVVSGSFNPSLVSIGIHSLTYNYTQNGCSSSITQTVQVLPVPSVSISSPTSGPWCDQEPGFTLLTIPATGGVLSGPGLVGNIFQPSVAGPGNHIIQYTYTGINGCANTAGLTLTVTPPPSPVIQQGSFMNICGSGFLSVNGNGSFQWFLNGNIINNATGNTINPVQSGSYTVQEIMNVCSGISAPIVVSYAPFVTAAFVTNINGMNVTFNNTSSNATQYSWDFGDSNISTLSSPSHTYASYGSYQVSLTVSNQHCSDVFMDTVFIGNVSADQQTKDTPFTLFPNPAQQVFTIISEYGLGNALTISLYDGAGKEVYTLHEHMFTGKAECRTDLSAGLYYLRIFNQTTGKQFGQRIQIE